MASKAKKLYSILSKIGMKNITVQKEGKTLFVRYCSPCPECGHVINIGTFSEALQKELIKKGEVRALDTAEMRDDENVGIFSVRKILSEAVSADVEFQNIYPSNC